MHLLSIPTKAANLKNPTLLVLYLKRDIYKMRKLLKKVSERDSPWN